MARFLRTYGVFALGLIAFFIYTGTFIVRDSIDGRIPLTNEQLRYLGVPLALFGAVQIALHWPAAALLARRNLPMILLVLYAFLTTLWSDDPKMTVVRSIAIAMALVGAIGLASRYRALDLALLCGIAFLAANVGAFIAWRLNDPAVYDWEIGGMRGAFTHKNIQGQAAAMGLILGAGLLMTRHWMIGLASVAFASLWVVKSHSATALVAGVLGVGVLGWLTLVASPRAPVFVKAMATGLGGVLGLLVYVGKDAALGAIGRDSSLTGRDEIWAFVIRQISERPFTGHGFRAYWSAKANEGEVEAYFTQDYDQAHNGVLQLTLDTGLVGLGIFLIWVAMGLFGALGGIRDAGRRIWFAVIVTVIVFSGSEAVFLMPMSTTWLMMLIGVCAVWIGQDQDPPVRRMRPRPRTRSVVS